MKKILVILILAVLAAGAAYYFKIRSDSGIGLKDVNWSKLGYTEDREPDRYNSGIYLLYEEPGSPALSAKLKFDENSTCTFGEQSTPCLALSVTFEDAFKNKKMFVEGVSSDDGVLVRNIAVDKEANRKFGFIKSIGKNDQNFLVVIDEVEFLSGDEAMSAAISDTGCNSEKVYDCAPSLNNGFYIRNISKETAPYILNENTRIKILKDPGSPDLVDAPLSTFVSKFNDPKSLMKDFSFQFLLDGALVIALEEQYVP